MKMILPGNSFEYALDINIKSLKHNPFFQKAYNHYWSIYEKLYSADGEEKNMLLKDLDDALLDLLDVMVGIFTKPEPV